MLPSILNRVGKPIIRRDYKDAITVLNACQSTIRIMGLANGNVNSKLFLPMIRKWVNRAGYDVKDFRKLNIFHVTGTKGKGSTCSFLSSILTEATKDAAWRAALVPTARPQSPGSPAKIGLFNSPHLREVRERIQINGEAISKEMFAHYFFDLQDRLARSESKFGELANAEGEFLNYHHTMVLLAFHVFYQEKVLASVIETGIGAEYDSTRVIDTALSTGILSLAVEHTDMLGDTIESIAWHKSGVFQRDIPAYSVHQPDAAAAVIRARAKEIGTADGGTVHFLDVHPEIASGAAPLGLEGEFQKQNATVAAAMAMRFFHDRGVGPAPGEALPESFKKALATTRWDGRCQIAPDTKTAGRVQWYIDGAHTSESIEVATGWFVKKTAQLGGIRVLVFSQERKNTRPMLEKLAEVAAEGGHESFFQYVIFPKTNLPVLQPNEDVSDERYRLDDFTVADRDRINKQVLSNWKSVGGITPGQTSLAANDMTDVSRYCREIAEKTGEQVHAFATGSLFLAGEVLNIAEEKPTV